MLETFPHLYSVIIAAVAFILGGLTYHIILFMALPNQHQLYAWIYARRDHRKFGEPCRTDMVLDRDGFSLGYSLEKRCALWVSYVITKGSVGVDIDRALSFYPDPDIPLKYRVKPGVFNNTGYDKGHLAPSATVDFSKRSNEQTFAMSNIALQHPKLNRQAWSALETIIRSWTHSKGKLFVVTGPIYGQRSKRIDEIPVPKSFYKVVYSFKHQKWIAFILPNSSVSSTKLWEHVTSVKEVETQAGCKFLKKLPKGKSGSKAKMDVKWWQEG